MTEKKVKATAQQKTQCRKPRIITLSTPVAENVMQQKRGQRTGTGRPQSGRNINGWQCQVLPKFTSDQRNVRREPQFIPP